MSGFLPCSGTRWRTDVPASGKPGSPLFAEDGSIFLRVSLHIQSERCYCVRWKGGRFCFPSGVVVSEQQYRAVKWTINHKQDRSHRYICILYLNTTTH